MGNEPFKIPNEIESKFPMVESFLDYSGAKRSFTISIIGVCGGMVLSAKEITEPPDGYEFDVFTTNDPWGALGTLRSKIRKGISTRYLHEDRRGISLAHNTIYGRISTGLLVDGKLRTYDDIINLLSIYQGHNIKIRITDPCDEK